jgi:hypothetical protein
MKSIYPIAMLALAASFTACSNDDNDNPYVKGDTDTMISFANPFINNSVKGQRAATPTTKENLDAFKVWGFVIDPGSVVFDGANVTRDGNDWKIDQTEYWYLGKPYYFTAIAGDADNYTFTPLTSAAPAPYQGGGTLKFDNAKAEGEDDLIYAFENIQYDDTAAVKPVPLTFSHLLSQVVFEFKNQMTANTSLVIKNLKIQDVASSGTIEFYGTNEWVASAVDNFTIDSIDTDLKFAFNRSVISEPSYIIPETASYGIEFDVDVYNANNLMATYHHRLSIPKTTFVKGNSYKFVATLQPENINPGQQLLPIEFTVQDVEQWIENDEVNIN